LFGIYRVTWCKRMYSKALGMLNYKRSLQSERYFTRSHVPFVL